MNTPRPSSRCNFRFSTGLGMHENGFRFQSLVNRSEPVPLGRSVPATRGKTKAGQRGAPPSSSFMNATRSCGLLFDLMVQARRMPWRVKPRWRPRVWRYFIAASNILATYSQLTRWSKNALR
jgi:hypothetical protein